NLADVVAVFFRVGQGDLIPASAGSTRRPARIVRSHARPRNVQQVPAPPGYPMYPQLRERARSSWKASGCFGLQSPLWSCLVMVWEFNTGFDSKCYLQYWVSWWAAPP